MDQKSDTEIISHVLNSKPDSFSLLFERYKHLVFHRVLMMLGKRNDAEDIVQEIFIQAYQGLDRLKKTAAFPAWLDRIAVNACINRMRGKKINHVSLDYLAEEGIELVDPGKNPGLNRERMLAIKRLIPSLPYKYREIMGMRYVEGYSYKKIADYLDLPMNTIRSRLFQARKKIIKLLEKEGWL